MGRWTREQLTEDYTDKNGKKRFRPYALFQVDFDRAEAVLGWKKDKVRRLLKLATMACILWDLGKLPPENGRKVYSPGVWMTIKGETWVNWFFKKDDHWLSIFRGFRCTGFLRKGKKD